MSKKVIAAALALAGAPTAWAGFLPIELTPGSYNQDIVVENTAASPVIPGGYTSATMDAGAANDGTSWYEQGYNPSAPTTGLPKAGATFTSQTSSSHVYTMASSYETNDAVLLDSTLTNATFTLLSPASFTQLSFLESGGNNGVTFNFTVHHANGVAETGAASIPDWYSGGTNVAWVANGRVNAQSFALDSVNSGDPRLFSLDVRLTNTTSPVTSIDFAYVSGGGHGAMMAVSGAMAGSFAPVAVTGYNEDIVVEATAGLPGALTGVTTATMDDELNTWYEQGYVALAPLTGLPPAGSYLTNVSAPDHVYQLAPSYESADALFLTSNAPNATVAFAAPSNYGALSFLVSASDGPVTVGCTILHTNGFAESNSLVVPDWYAESPVAFAANGRVNIGNKTLSFLDASNPSLYAADVPLLNASTPIASIAFSWLAGDPNANVAVFAVSGGAPSTSQKDDDFNANTMAAVNVLQQWYTGGGLYNSTGWWNAANCLEALENAVYANSSFALLNVISNTFVLNSNSLYLNDYYDDEGWWANAWIRAYDQTGDTNYLAMSKIIFADLLTGWNNACGGGLWWNKWETNKGAVENDLFILTAIRLHQRTPGDGAGSGSYFYWATNAWTWFKNSGMINSQSLVNDGLDPSTCQNNGDPTWTYNQGVLIGALTDLYKATGSNAYLTEATAIANAVAANLVDGNGVLEEPWPCNPTCGGGDVPEFKGICVRYMAYLYDLTRNPAYYSFLYKSAHAVWFKDRNTFDQLGMSWDGPFDSADAARQSSAIMAISALAEPATTNLVFGKGSADPAFSHNIGSATGFLAWACGPTNASQPGYAQTGPHVAYLTAGLHAVHFQIAADALSQSGTNLAMLSVMEDNGSNILASAPVPWNAFVEAGRPHDFVLLFTNSVAGDPLQFQVYWNNLSGGPNLAISDLTVDGFLNWTGANLTHDIGQLDGLNAWQADLFSASASGYLARGPGTKEIPPGTYAARFELKVDNFNYDSNVVGTISVYDLDHNATVAFQNVTRNQFPNTLYQTFALNFTALAGTHYDFRVSWYRTANAPRLTLRSITLRPTGSPFFKSAQVINGAVLLNLIGVPGQTCSLQVTSNLAAPYWTTEQTAQLPVNLGFMQLTDVLAGGARFYRLVAR